LLSFYEDDMQGTTFRKAEIINDIDNWRVQLIAAGVAEDWSDFVTRSGPKSGYLARVLPVLGCDREMIRLMQYRLPSFALPLNGITEVLGIMEKKYCEFFSPW